MFPDYHYALGTLAQVKQAQNRNEEAVALLEKRYAAAPHAENQFALAEALDKAGHKDAAAKAFAGFEQKALAESNITDNANHELIAYYVDYAHEPAKALKIATARAGAPSRRVYSGCLRVVARGRRRLRKGKRGNAEGGCVRRQGQQGAAPCE